MGFWRVFLHKHGLGDGRGCKNHDKTGIIKTKLVSSTKKNILAA